MKKKNISLKKFIVAGLIATSTSIPLASVAMPVTVQAATKNGWIKENGGFKYYKNGKAYTGWHKMGKAEGEKKEHWSYFGKDGKIYTGWKRMGKAEGEKTVHWSYFGDNGWLRTGWQTMATKANPDGKNKTHVSYFGSNGWLRTGWVQLGKGTTEPDGNSAKHWSYFGDNGWLRTGWQQMGKGTANPDGKSAKHWSYFGTNGWLRTGLQDMGKGTKNPDGNAEKHKSYFGDNGWLRVNQILTISGKKYKADGMGWLSVVKSEETVFMDYIKRLYKNADDYVGGWPAYYNTDWEYYDHYIKYAIADVIGDSQKELIILRDSHVPSGGPFVEIYDAKQNAVRKRATELYPFVVWFSNKIPNFVFYNNGVVSYKTTQKFNNKALDNSIYYCTFNTEILKKLGIYEDACPRGIWYENKGNKMIRHEIYQEDITKTLSTSAYNSEIKLLTSGKKVNVVFKDINAKNLNIK